MKASLHPFPIQSAAVLLACLGACVTGTREVQAESILTSKHNLSASGSGPVKAIAEYRVCVFCHAPHKTAPVTPLWNHQLSTATYTPYSSTTLKATVGQPNGASKLCLSCHDGTVALGAVYSHATPIQMANSVTVMPPGRANVGTDLSGDHPISFTYDENLVALNGKLKSPDTLKNQVRLDHNSQMQCTSCHDPHNNQFGNFLVMSDTGSTLCIQCHSVSGWASGSHANTPAPLVPNASTKGLPAADQTPAKASGGCANCHVPHGSPGKQRLFKSAREDQTCYACHGGKATISDIQSEFKKVSTHPVFTTQQEHNPMEDAVNATRHVGCSDCHDSHASVPGVAPAPRAGGPIQGTLGVDIGGARVSAINLEYEQCFRCHADSVTRGMARVDRHSAETNTRLEFNPANASFHPVAALGRNPNVPSLIAPLTVSSFIKCTDCHNNNNGPGAGGKGPNGPHGSMYTPLLERSLSFVDRQPESQGAYALCYKCHSRASILSDQSFKGHRKHVVEQRTACTTCHDSHGVADAPHLINFSASYVQPAADGRLEYVSTGRFSGNCTLSCHGKPHDRARYP